MEIIRTRNISPGKALARDSGRGAVRLGVAAALGRRSHAHDSHLSRVIGVNTITGGALALASARNCVTSLTKRTKWQSERTALRLAPNHCSVVVVTLPSRSDPEEGTALL